MQFAVGFQTRLERGAQVRFGRLVLPQRDVSPSERHQNVGHYLRLISQLCFGATGSVAQDIGYLDVNAFHFGRSGAEHVLQESVDALRYVPLGAGLPGFQSAAIKPTTTATTTRRAAATPTRCRRINFALR